MKEFIFKYAINASNTLVKWLTVKANVISIFTYKNSTSLLDPGSYEFAMLGDFKQCNPACKDMPYGAIMDKDPAHKIINPHINAAEQKWEHFHLKLCELTTPTDFNCFLDQLEQFQKNPQAREALTKKPAVLQSQYFAKLLLNKTTTIDTNSDYLPEKDYLTAKNAYAEYFAKHQQDIIAQCQKIQNDFTWSDELAEIGSEVKDTLLYSAALAALYSFLRETLIANNISKTNAEWFVHAAVLSTIAITGSTWYPLIAAVAITTTLKLLKAPDKMTQISSIIGATLITIAKDYPTDAFSLLKLSINFLSALPCTYVTSSLMGAATQQLWRCFKPSAETATSSLEQTRIAPSKKIN